MHHDAYSKKHHPESDSILRPYWETNHPYSFLCSLAQDRYICFYYFIAHLHISVPYVVRLNRHFRKRQLTERVTYVGGGSDIITNNNSSRNSGHPRFRYSHGSSSARGLGAFIIYLSSRSTQCFHQNNKTSRLHS